MFLAGLVPEYRQLGDILAGGISAGWESCQLRREQADEAPLSLSLWPFFFAGILLSPQSCETTF
jgi:hypothetical protein